MFFFVLFFLNLLMIFGICICIKRTNALFFSFVFIFLKFNDCLLLDRTEQDVMPVITNSLKKEKKEKKTRKEGRKTILL